MDAVHKGDRSLEPGSVPWKRRTSLGLGNFTGGETPCHLPRLLYSPGLMRGATRLGCGGFPALSHSCCHPHAHQRLIRGPSGSCVGAEARSTRDPWALQASAEGRPAPHTWACREPGGTGSSLRFCPATMCTHTSISSRLHYLICKMT